MHTLSIVLLAASPFIILYILIDWQLTRLSKLINYNHPGCIPVKVSDSLPVPEGSTEPVVEDKLVPRIKSFQFIPGTSAKAYVILGGSGFIGSWIVRLLLHLGAHTGGQPAIGCAVIDIADLPADIRRQNVPFVRCDVRDKSALEAAIKTALDATLQATGGSAEVVFVNCASAKRLGATGPAEAAGADVNIRGMENLVDVVTALPADKRICGITLAAVADAVVHQRAPNWWQLWRIAKPQLFTSFFSCGNPSATESAAPLGSYALSQRHAVATLLSCDNATLAHFPFRISATALCPAGPVSGHLNDNLIEPALDIGRVVNFAPHSPVALLHVEDVALSLLQLLETPDCSGKCPILLPAGSDQFIPLITWDAVWNHVAFLAPAFRHVHVNAIIAFIVAAGGSAVAGVKARINRAKPLTAPHLRRNRKIWSLFAGYTSEHTLARFGYFLAQAVPAVAENAEKSTNFVAAYTAEEVLQNLMADYKKKQEFIAGKKAELGIED